MKIGGTNGLGGPQKVYPNSAAGQPVRPGAPKAGASADRVEISEAARIRDAVARTPEIRADKVAQAREMIAAGQMDTPERMGVALDRLLEDLIEP